MNDLQLLALCEAATPGPWAAGRSATECPRRYLRAVREARPDVLFEVVMRIPREHCGCANVYHEEDGTDVTAPHPGLSDADAAFIAAARGAMPELLDRIARLNEEVLRLEAYGQEMDQRLGKANREVRRLRCDYRTLAETWRHQAPPGWPEPHVQISICERLLERSRRHYPDAGDDDR